MSAQSKKRQELTEKIEANKRQLAALNSENDAHGKQRIRLQQTLLNLKQNLEIFESDLVVKEVGKKGVEIPSRHDKPTWHEDDQDEDAPIPEYAVTRWLSPTGRIMVRKMIKEERRKNIEWWVKIISPLLASLISLLGLIVALVTVSKC